MKSRNLNSILSATISLSGWTTLLFQRLQISKNKLLPGKQLLNLKAWFAKYDFTVQHIKGDKNLIYDFLTCPYINKPTLVTFIQVIPIIDMNRSLHFKALTQKTFPLNLSFNSAF